MITHIEIHRQFMSREGMKLQDMKYHDMSHQDMIRHLEIVFHLIHQDQVILLQVLKHQQEIGETIDE
jgi:hypothetical protein